MEDSVYNSRPTLIGRSRLSMKTYNLFFLGFGTIGRALARMLQEEQPLLRETYAASFQLAGVATRRHGCAWNPAGLDPAEFLRLSDSGERIGKVSFEEAGLESLLKDSQADILVEITPTNRENGEPAISHIRTALRGGRHVVTANKGPVAYAYRELRDLARQAGRQLPVRSRGHGRHAALLPAAGSASGRAHPRVPRDPQFHDQLPADPHGEGNGFRGGGGGGAVGRDRRNRSAGGCGGLGRRAEGGGAGERDDGFPARAGGGHAPGHRHSGSGGESAAPGRRTGPSSLSAAPSAPPTAWRAPSGRNSFPRTTRWHR